MLIDILSTLATALASILVVLAGYLTVLTVAAFLNRSRRAVEGPQTTRFAVLVPAHDEEVLISRTVSNLLAQDYPGGRFDVHVVADNCTDRTAELARAAGAQVHERHDLSARGKGRALRWLLANLKQAGQSYDAYIILDADSVVDADFLKVMDARLGNGSQVIQAYYTVLNDGESAVAALRFAALAAVHYLRPQGRALFGFSAGLKGNGMCFSAAVVERFGWEWFTLAEDVEFHLQLVRAGIRVDFAGETRVLADMPATFEQASSQNARWERGRFQLLRTHVLPLVAEGLRGSALKLDAAIEQLIPPLVRTYIQPGCPGVARNIHDGMQGCDKLAFGPGASSRNVALNIPEDVSTARSAKVLYNGTAGSAFTLSVNGNDINVPTAKCCFMEALNVVDVPVSMLRQGPNNLTLIYRGNLRDAPDLAQVELEVVYNQPRPATAPAMTMSHAGMVMSAAEPMAMLSLTNMNFRLDQQRGDPAVRKATTYLYSLGGAQPVPYSVKVITNTPWLTVSNSSGTVTSPTQGGGVTPLDLNVDFSKLKTDSDGEVAVIRVDGGGMPLYAALLAVNDGSGDAPSFIPTFSNVITNFNRDALPGVGSAAPTVSAPSVMVESS